MRTDDLIDSLSSNLKPVRPSAMTLALLVGLVCGAVAATGLMLGWLGLRPDLAFAVRTAPFWMKFVYTALLALVGFFLADRAGRPGSRLMPASLLILLAVGMIGAVGLVQVMQAPRWLWMPMFLGESYLVCPWRIVVLSIPILIGVLLMLRRMAPTRPALAGAVAGVLSGAAGATVYGLHCGESSALFTAFWYTLGIAVVGGVGALAGRFALRW